MSWKNKRYATESSAVCRKSVGSSGAGRGRYANNVSTEKSFSLGAKHACASLLEPKAVAGPDDFLLTTLRDEATTTKAQQQIMQIIDGASFCLVRLRARSEYHPLIYTPYNRENLETHFEWRNESFHDNDIAFQRRPFNAS